MRDSVRAEPVEQALIEIDWAIGAGKYEVSLAIGDAAALAGEVATLRTQLAQAQADLLDKARLAQLGTNMTALAESAALRLELAAARHDCECYRETLVDNETYCEAMSAALAAKTVDYDGVLERLGCLLADDSPSNRQRIICELWQRGGLSEGQASKLLQLNRIEARQLAIDLGVPIYGAPEVQP